MSEHMDYEITRVTSVEDLWECSKLLTGNNRRCIDYALGPALRGCGIVVCAKASTQQVVALIWGQWTEDPETLFVPYVFVQEVSRGSSLVRRLDEELGVHAIKAGRRYSFGLADPENYASNKAIIASGYKLVHSGRRFYYPDARGHFYFKDRLDQDNHSPPRGSTFWSAVMSTEPIYNEIEVQGRAPLARDHM